MLELDARVPLRRLEIFCVVVDEGGMTRAADRLYMAQPAVSSQIRALEEWLGTALFRRRGNQMVLTAAGRRVHDYAVEVLSRSHEMLRDVRRINDGTAGEIIVLSDSLAGSYLVPPVLTSLGERFSKATFTARHGDPEPMMRLLERDGGNIALLTLTDKPPSDVVVDHVHSEPIVLVTSQGNGAIPQTLDVDDVPSLDFVGGPPPLAARMRRLCQAGAPDLAIEPRLHLPHAEPIKRALLRERYVALLPLYAVEEELAAETLRIVAVSGLELVEHTSLMYRAREALSPLQRMTISALRTVLLERAAGRAASVPGVFG